MHDAILVIGDSIKEQMWAYYYINPRHPEPKMTWDSYEIGGRWSDFWMLKGRGYRTAQAQKFEIDFEGMRHDAAQKALTTWEKIRVITEGESWISLETLRSQFGDTNDILEKYQNQPAIKRITNYNNRLPISDPSAIKKDDALALDKETYVQIETGRACICGSRVLQNGLATVKQDTMPFMEWNEIINKKLDNLPDEVTLSVIDFHW